MKLDYDVVVVGGGLAGLTAAIHLGLEGVSVLVLEKNTYPHHKVCGEYVSNEVLPYLQKLGVSLQAAGAPTISKFQLSQGNGKVLEADLPLGGFGISRYAFDELLYKRALEVGVEVQFEKVTGILFKKSSFEVVISNGKKFTSRVVLGAYGKRSTLDKKLNRDFITEKSAWVAVKNHYKWNVFPDDVVALHNFHGGYGGLSKTESGEVNFCYMAHYDSFQKFKKVEDFNGQIIAQNKFLKDFLQEAEPVFEQPLTIAQISFRPKKAVENHVLMIGDTAGLIHPLCGNGMAMAIHSAKIASELVVSYVKSGQENRSLLEKSYQQEWKKTFNARLYWGRQLQRILLRPTLSNIIISLVGKSSKLLKATIAATHGKPLV
ncbi:NAD(P)/FAD-dependent oxidoreductase [Cytophaga sp. FL35]|uniref:NAD(P)/FAD-dependent oxidoreductase n=1 Tax=Cytophaga sp. FL35 TaxID=1904456 RepID=UPI0016536B30|nr:NAD(P)/FAD-dependent oxidoreductase [Cytophaga sp. FL35]